MMIDRGVMRAAAVLAVGTAFGQPIAAGAQTASSGQAYPTKPVRVIVAFAAGGFADYMGRRSGKSSATGWGSSS